MKWKGRRGSKNIEDRRTMGKGAKAIGGGGLGLILVLIIGAFLGIDVSGLMSGGGLGSQSGGATSTELTEADKVAGEFVSVTLADTEEIWTNIFREQVGKPYTPAALVLFKGVTQSPCGGASGATGPFYCPGDKKAYLDTSFFATLSQRMGAKGDFAAAYVVAHEIAHHVQNELGILGRANTLRRQVSQAESNAISVRVELQADCYSGIWARNAHERFGSIEEGDLEEAVNAAKQIGDDTIQRNAGRVPSPHTFTHGTSEQRMRWFLIGLKSGQMSDCDTFSAQNL
jgi:predicted metalloprotease